MYKADTTTQNDAVSWLLRTFYLAESGSVSKAEVYAAYECFCEGKGLSPFNRAVFGRMIVGKAFPSLKTRRQGRRGNVKYHYMQLQFVNLSDRPPKSMWDQEEPENSDGDTEESPSAGTKNGKRKRKQHSKEKDAKKSRTNNNLIIELTKEEKDSRVNPSLKLENDGYQSIEEAESTIIRKEFYATPVHYPTRLQHYFHQPYCSATSSSRQHPHHQQQQQHAQQHAQQHCVQHALQQQALHRLPHVAEELQRIFDCRLPSVKSELKQEEAEEGEPSTFSLFDPSSSGSSTSTFILSQLQQQPQQQTQHPQQPPKTEEEAIQRSDVAPFYFTSLYDLSQLQQHAQHAQQNTRQQSSQAGLEDYLVALREEKQEDLWRHLPDNPWVQFDYGPVMRLLGSGGSGGLLASLGDEAEPAGSDTTNDEYNPKQE